MRFSTQLLAAGALLAGHSLAVTHRLYTSSFTSPDMFLLEFDEAARTLKQVRQLQAHGAHPSLAFSYDKTVMYAGEKGGWASYSVGDDGGTYSLTYNSSVPLLGACAGAFQNYPWGAPSVVAEFKGPYMVYGAPLGSCGNAIAVTNELEFDYISQNVTYNKPGSAVRGLAMDPDNTVLYSADLGANGIWVHSINAANGLLTNVGFLPAHIANAGPRRIVVHPGGKYMYVLLERANLIAVYAVNQPKNGAYPTGPISFTGLTYALIPKAENPANYWASEIALSEDGTMLLATTRYKNSAMQTSWDTVSGQAPYAPPLYQYYVAGAQSASRPSGKGYVTAILLTPNEDGSDDPATAGNRVGPGYPLRVLFQQLTSASGGMSNSISPAPWGRQYFALSDSEYGVVEIWKIDGIDTPNFDGTLGGGALTATVGGWAMGTWSQTAALSYQNQYQAPGPAIFDPLEPTTTSKYGINTTVPRPYVPVSYYSTPGKNPPAPTAAPAPQQPTRPGTQQPTRPQQPQQPQYPQYPQQPQQPQYPQYPQQPQYPQYPQQPQNPRQPYQSPYVPQYYPQGNVQGSRPSSQNTRPRNGRTGFRRLVRKWLGMEIEKRQIVPVPALQPVLPPVTVRVAAAWQAGYVKSTGPQAGCCTSPLWFD